MNEKDRPEDRNGFVFAFNSKKYDIVIYLLEHGSEIDEEYNKKIQNDIELCKKIKNRIVEITTIQNTIKEIWNEIDINVICEIQKFTHGLHNLQNKTNF